MSGILNLDQTYPPPPHIIGWTVTLLLVYYLLFYMNNIIGTDCDEFKLCVCAHIVSNVYLISIIVNLSKLGDL